MILLEILILKLIHVTENSEDNDRCRILQVHVCNIVYLTNQTSR